jgi:hypothetical protein
MECEVWAKDFDNEDENEDDPKGCVISLKDLP